MATIENSTPTRVRAQESADQINAAQKQALLDNLQVEVTERARKLRAQYAVLSSSLQARLEMRINRIPTALRSVNISDLIDKYAEQLDQPASRQTTAAPQTSYHNIGTQIKRKPVALVDPTRQRGTKRSSADMMGPETIGSDKENQTHELSLPRKRTRVAAPPVSAATTANRAASRRVEPGQVLSPKSLNSRTLPQSPLKANPAVKPSVARAPSPAKPAPAAPAASTKTEKPRTARPKAPTGKPAAQSVRGKRGAAPTPAPPPTARTARGRVASDSSNTSDASAGTTVVTKKKAPSPVKRGGIIGKVAGMATAAAGRRAAAKKTAAPAPVETGRRVLRNRK